MLKNYLITTIRHIFKNKIYSFINLLGLSVGITCTILILVWVRYELNYDNFHQNLDRIYRVVSEYDGLRTPTTPGPMAAYLKNEIPEIVEATRFKGDNTILEYEGKSCKIYGLNVEPQFFTLFSFPQIEGNSASALDDVSSIVLTKSSAVKLFGDENPIGKVVKVSNKWTSTVRGIVEDVPENSSPPLKFDYLYPFKVYYYWREPDSWSRNSDYYTWVMLDQNVDFSVVNKKIDDLIKSHNPDPKLRFFIQPLTDIHLNADTHRWDGPHGNMESLYIFSMLAIIILAIACINFTNLATAKSVIRSREIVIRKVIGATRSQIIRQHFGEAFIFALLSIPISILFIELILPIFNNIAGHQYIINYIEPWFIAAMLIIVFITGLFSGIYPALLLSSSKISTLLMKGNMFDGIRKNKLSLRKILVVFQFAISVMVIISTLVIFGQLNYVFEKDLGYKKDNLIYVTNGQHYKPETYTSFKNNLMALPSVISVGTSDQIPTDTDFITGVEWFKGNQKIRSSAPAFMVDEGFISTYDIEIKEGTDFLIRNKASLAESFILNETAVKEFGLDDPIGQYFEAHGKKGKIIGVVKDFHFENLKEKIEPMVFIYDKERYLINIRIEETNKKETIAKIEALVNEHFPGHPFEYHFLDSLVEDLYKQELRLGELFKYFSFLALFISLLGLYGMVSFIIEQKTKEISIRKVLGASVIEIVKSFTSRFIVLILIANIIAWPLAYYFMNKWLQNFEYKESIDLSLFLIAGTVILILSMITVSYHAVKAALINPVESLRNE